MAVKGSRVTVTVTAVALATGAGRTGKQKELRVRIQNPTGGQVVYLGGSDVSSSVYGYALAVGSEVELEIQSGDTIYGAVAATTQIVNVFVNGS